jgi:hypothetical protein
MKPPAREVLDDIATKLRVAHEILIDAVEDLGGYPGAYPPSRKLWDKQQAALWYAVDAVGAHAKELRKALRKAEKRS